MRRKQDWWKRKCRIAFKALALMILAVGLCTFLSIYFANTFVLGLPVPYWLYLIVLPAMLIALLFSHNREDMANDRIHDHSGIQ